MTTTEKHSVKQLLDENLELKNQNIDLQNQIMQLSEQLEWFRRQVFGQKSEKITNLDESQLELFAYSVDDKIPSKTETVVSHKRAKPNRDGRYKVNLPDNLPVERIFIDTSEEEKICKETGEALVKIGEEVSRKLAQKPGSCFIKEIVRPKYAHPTNKDKGIVIADLSESLLPRCEADESFLAHVFTTKFADHVPLYRLSEILAREKIDISRQLLSQWVLRAGDALSCLHKEIKKQILQGDYIFVDESPLDMQTPGKGKLHQGYMWVLVGGDPDNPTSCYYDFRENRKHENATKILANYHKVLHSDKYGAYEKLANKKKIIWCPCWSHIRRKFFESQSGDIAFRDWVLLKIKDLFLIERTAWGKSPEERLKIREKEEIPIIDELVTAIKDKLIHGKLLPKSKLREALGYFCGLIPYLKNYTKYPFARLENNVAERAIRPLAIGRKNWLFVGSENGGQAAAVFLSLVQSCRLAKVNPREYLEDVMRRLMAHPANKVHELLPEYWAKNRPRPLV